MNCLPLLTNYLPGYRFSAFSPLACLSPSGPSLQVVSWYPSASFKKQQNSLEAKNGKKRLQSKSWVENFRSRWKLRLVTSWKNWQMRSTKWVDNWPQRSLDLKARWNWKLKCWTVFQIPSLSSTRIKRSNISTMLPKKLLNLWRMGRSKANHSFRFFLLMMRLKKNSVRNFKPSGRLIAAQNRSLRITLQPSPLKW